MLKLFKKDNQKTYIPEFDKDEKERFFEGYELKKFESCIGYFPGNYLFNFSNDMLLKAFDSIITAVDRKHDCAAKPGMTANDRYKLLDEKIIVEVKYTMKAVIFDESGNVIRLFIDGKCSKCELADRGHHHTLCIEYGRGINLHDVIETGFEKYCELQKIKGAKTTHDEAMIVAIGECFKMGVSSYKTLDSSYADPIIEKAILQFCK